MLQWGFTAKWPTPTNNYLNQQLKLNAAQKYDFYVMNACIRGLFLQGQGFVKSTRSSARLEIENYESWWGWQLHLTKHLHRLFSSVFYSKVKFIQVKFCKPEILLRILKIDHSSVLLFILTLTGHNAPENQKFKRDRTCLLLKWADSWNWTHLNILPSGVTRRWSSRSPSRSRGGCVLEEGDYDMITSDWDWMSVISFKWK